MNLSEWRQKMAEGEAYTLPSGLTVKLRRVSLLDLAEQGEIPAPLVSAVNAIFDSRVRNLKVEDIGRFADAVNLLVHAALIDPAPGKQEDDTHICVASMPMKDRLAIYNWCQEAQGLTPFRGESGESEAA